jgi:putative ABC transport system permease protein
MIRRIFAIPGYLGRWLLAGLSRNGQNVGTAFVQVWAHKGRSILTTLGIIIAVTSIITVVSFVEGFGNYVTTMLRGYGTQYIVVHPFDPRGHHRHGMPTTTMDIEDVEAIRAECTNIRRISPFIYTQVELSYGGEEADDIACRGVSEQYQVILRTCRLGERRTGLRARPEPDEVA